MLKQWQHIVIDLRKSDSKCYKLLSTYYKLKYKEIHKEVIIDSLKNTYLSKGYIYDVYYTLNMYNLNTYFDINQIPKEKKEWNKIIEKKIKDYHWKKDLENINKSKNLFIKTIIEMNGI